MGLSDFTIYLDSCLVIYLVEEDAVYAPILESALADYRSAKICVSLLIEMECLIMPIRRQNHLLIEKFKNWLSKVETLPIEFEVFQKATQLRADFPTLKTPDALHIATSIHYGCDEFWTNDGRLAKFAPDLVKKIL